MGSTFEDITKILLSRTPLPSLLAPPPVDRSKRVSSTPWNQILSNDITQLQKDSTIPLFAIASLHLFNDDIGSCHDIVEKHGGNSIADYLHYLLHRREGDYWNAKWWIRQLKSEEFQSIYLTEKYQSFSNQKSLSLDEAQKRAQAFVDRCEQVEKGNNQKEKDFLKQLQSDEMIAVFHFSQK